MLSCEMNKHNNSITPHFHRLLCVQNKQHFFAKIKPSTSYLLHYHLSYHCIHNVQKKEAPLYLKEHKWF